MLKEIHGVADDPPARRRWFHDDFFDLFVWQTGGEVTLFQLCYGLDSSDRALVWDKARAGVMEKTGGHYPAPLVAISIMRDGLKLPIRRALDLEAGAFAELVVSDAAKSLMSIFFMKNEVEARAAEHRTPDR